MAGTATRRPPVTMPPNGDQARELATYLRREWAGVLENMSARSVVEAFGWRFSIRPVESPTSTLQSLLLPVLDGGFSVVVNGHYAWTEAEALWLAAHEIGHSFFYTNGAPPRRIVPCTPVEEQFCDVFADHLLGERPDGLLRQVA